MNPDLSLVDSEKTEDAIIWLCYRFKLKRSEITVGEFRNVRDDTTGEIVIAGTISQGAFHYTLKGTYVAKSKILYSSRKSKSQSIMDKQRAILKKRNAKAKLDPLRAL